MSTPAERPLQGSSHCPNLSSVIGCALSPEKESASSPLGSAFGRSLFIQKPSSYPVAKGLHIVTEEKGAIEEEPIFSEMSGSFEGGAS